MNIDSGTTCLASIPHEYCMRVVIRSHLVYVALSILDNTTVRDYSFTVIARGTGKIVYISDNCIVCVCF